MQQLENQKNEEWKMIPNHTKYEVSDSGQVRHRKYQRVLKPSYPYNKYPQVKIFNDNKNKKITTCIHQLVALAWLGEKPKGYEVDHKDSNRQNNNLSNLSYLPWRENRNSKTISIPIPISYCIVCGKRVKGKNVRYCSKECKLSALYTLLECLTCGKKFYRKNSVIRENSPKHGYTLGRTFCSQECHHNFSKAFYPQHQKKEEK